MEPDPVARRRSAWPFAALAQVVLMLAPAFLFHGEQAVAADTDTRYLKVTPAELDIHATAALVVDEQGRTLYAKRTRERKPIASITKLMTAMVVLDSGAPLNEPVTIEESDRDTLRNSRSRLRIDRHATLPRGEMLAVALMSSDNRAASALGRTALTGGKPAFVEAMNRKAAELGMTDTLFADPTGLDGRNQSTAEDLLKLIRAAADYPLIREITSRDSMQVAPHGDSGALEYRNTNPLVKSPEWQIEVSKTGFINEAGHCLVMRAVVGGRRLDIVLLDASGKRTPVGDAGRLRQWVVAQRSQQPARLAGSQKNPCADPWALSCWE
jgi:serine-type D-Ala-D-Ala endopeptidase (penicillin-binding protein 7)